MTPPPPPRAKKWSSSIWVSLLPTPCLYYWSISQRHAGISHHFRPQCLHGPVQGWLATAPSGLGHSRPQSSRLLLALHVKPATGVRHLDAGGVWILNIRNDQIRRRRTEVVWILSRRWRFGHGVWEADPQYPRLNIWSAVLSTRGSSPKYLEQFCIYFIYINDLSYQVW